MRFQAAAVLALVGILCACDAQEPLNRLVVINGVTVHWCDDLSPEARRRLKQTGELQYLQQVACFQECDGYNVMPYVQCATDPSGDAAIAAALEEPK